MRIVAVGNGRTVHALVRSAALAARGHDVRLVTLGPVLPVSGIEVRTRPLPEGAFTAVQAARGFVRDVRSFRPDLMHVHYAGSRLGTMATVCGVRPLVVTVMGGDVQPEQHLDGLAATEHRATRRILEEADLILAKSEALHAEIARFGDFAAKVRTVRWGVDPERFRPRPEEGRALRARLGLSASARVILSPRLLRPLYNIELLVDALALVVRAHPEAVLLLSGHRADDAYRARLEGKVRAHGLGAHVHFVGAIGHAEMPAYYALADVSVNLPFSDGLPTSLFEAMACETPSVLGRLAAYAEAVTEGEHVLLADFTPEAVAGAVGALLADDALRRRLGAAGRTRVLEIASLPREAERVEGFYRELLARPRRAPSWPRLALDAFTLFAR